MKVGDCYIDNNSRILKILSFNGSTFRALYDDGKKRWGYTTDVEWGIGNKSYKKINTKFANLFFTKE